MTITPGIFYRINDAVILAGKIDWELRDYNAKEYSTHKGTSYNSYLVTDEKRCMDFGKSI